MMSTRGLPKESRKASEAMQMGCEGPRCWPSTGHAPPMRSHSVSRVLSPCQGTPGFLKVTFPGTCGQSDFGINPSAFLPSFLLRNVVKEKTEEWGEFVFREGHRPQF